MTPPTVAVSGRITQDEKRQVSAYADAVSKRNKMRIGPSTAIAMLIREGLEAVAKREGMAA